MVSLPLLLCVESENKSTITSYWALYWWPWKGHVFGWFSPLWGEEKTKQKTKYGSLLWNYHLLMNVFPTYKLAEDLKQDPTDSMEVFQLVGKRVVVVINSITLGHSEAESPVRQGTVKTAQATRSTAAHSKGKLGIEWQTVKLIPSGKFVFLKGPNYKLQSLLRASGFRWHHSRVKLADQIHWSLLFSTTPLIIINVSFYAPELLGSHLIVVKPWQCC